MKQITFIFSLLIIAQTVLAQRKLDPDALAKRNEKLELLLIDYKQKLEKADSDIKRLSVENASIQRNIGVLMRKSDKSIADIRDLQEDRQRLLANKITMESLLKEREKTIKALEEVNKELRNDNARLKSANALLEEAAMMSDTIQLYQDLMINVQKESIEQLMSNYSEECSQVVGQYNVPFSKDKLEVMMEGVSQAPDNKLIESLKVKVCYQIQNPESSNKIMVYFVLYEGDKKRVLRQEVFPVNKKIVEHNVSYYEGTQIISTEGKYQLSGQSNYFYEIKYLEKVIAKGIFKPS